MGDTRVEVSPSAETDNTSGATSAAGEGFKAITSQDELNRVLADRLERERAKFADYKDVKAKAARLDEIEAANKTEAEKLAERTAAAERERDAARSEALRLRIAAKHSISDEDADLFLTGTDEETLTRQAQRLADRAATRKPGIVSPREGTNQTTQSGSDERAFVRQLFARANTD
jgi:hypothetical protein